MPEIAGVAAYSALTTQSPLRIKRWSHRARFRAALALAPHAPRLVLDYGAGDGHLLTLLPGDCEAWAFEPSAEMMSASSDWRLVRISCDLPSSHFDVIFCLEVLEHLDATRMGEAMAGIARCLAPNGVAIVSVPIEVGPSGIAKHLLRTALGCRHGPRTPDANGYIASHEGFDYRRLPFETHGLRVERETFSPLPILRGALNSQALFKLTHQSISP